MKTKQELPNSLKNKMNMWRHGHTEFPKEYISFHYKLAKASKLSPEFQDRFEIYRSTMESDGWMDAMKVMTLVVEERKTHKFYRLRWHDGGQGWMKECPSGGWSSFKI